MLPPTTFASSPEGVYAFLMLPIEVFRNGFRANLTEERAQQMLASLELPPEGGGLGTLERAGVISAVFGAFPKLDAWETEPYKEWLADTFKLEGSGQAFADGGSAEWNGYYAARFAVAGAVSDLAELVRRAKHRDGSTAAIGTSSGALSLLSEASDGDPEIALRIAAAGLNLSDVRFGNYPVGGPPPAVAPAVVTIPIDEHNHAAKVQEALEGGLSPATPMPPAARVLAFSQPLGSPNVAAAVSANMDAGDVSVGGARLSITAAVNLATSLTAAARALLVPAEGCSWIDDQTDPAKQSELVVLDPVLAEGLPPSAWSGALLAELAQSVENGTYRVKVYDRNGGSTFVTGSWTDMNDAKAAAAERVRPELQRILGL